MRTARLYFGAVLGSQFIAAELVIILVPPLHWRVPLDALAVLGSSTRDTQRGFDGGRIAREPESKALPRANRAFMGPG